MTFLKKVVSRKLDTHDAHGKQLVVMLEPGGTIAMREAGKRIVYRGSLEKVYWVLAKWHAADELKQKQLARKANRNKPKDDWRRHTFDDDGPKYNGPYDLSDERHPANRSVRG